MRLALLSLTALLGTSIVTADPLSKALEIDFFREVPNRNLKGLAVRSDGRVLSGPIVQDFAGKVPADLLWTFAPTADGRAWFVGTGPEGKIFRVSARPGAELDVQEIVDLEATQVFAILPLSDGTLLAGTSPQGTVSLLRDGKVVASVTLPVDSVLDLLPPAGARREVLVATGNPGRIYRLDLATFAAAGENKTKAAGDDLAKLGVTLFGEIRDRNVRRLLALPDGRVIAGSAPRGNVYAFAAGGGAPLILLENREAEVTDLLADTDGSFFAAVTAAGTSGEARVTRPTPAPAPATPPSDSDADRTERFTGRGQLVFFPAGGLPETIVSRANTAFYRLAWHQDERTRWILISGGEQGEMLAYSPSERRSLNLGATASAQVNAIAPLPGAAGSFLLLRNNPAGFSQLNFSTSAERTLETRKLDLGVPAEIGQVRFDRVAGLAADGLQVSLRTSFGSDELEGWSEWIKLQPAEGGGWFAPNLRGRYVQLRVSLTGGDGRAPLIDGVTLHHLPQNRRPQLTDFRIFPANLGLVPAPEPPPANPNMTLGQLLFPNQREQKDDANAAPNRRRTAFLNSQVVPQPGAQFVLWTITDPDDDNLAATFSLSPEGSEEWTDLVIDTANSYVQFDVTHLPEGRYRSRLKVREQAPRPESQRLTYTFETDSLTVDRTAPEIIRTGLERPLRFLRVLVEGRDALSQLEGAEFILNNGQRVALEHPVDGILDGQRETFVAEFPEALAAGATSVEILLYDKSGNSSSRRISLQ